ncbi:MAG: GAF domain-containing protein [Aphanothece sp. CMT-3BRIN-NPC111]|jgi:PAS domain S-box-containing protein|nr:GAF domain-containing protein [Aphanothece sp. CMT-3BRIN-NPC111]
MQEEIEREYILATIALRIRQSLDLDEILNTTVAEVRQFLQTDRVIIYRFDPGWSGAVTVESVADGWMPILGTIVNDTYFAENYVHLYKKGRIQVTADIYAAGLSQCHIDLLARFQIRANLVVPIFQGEELWGLLVANHCSEPRQWQQSEIDLLQKLATQVAIAIQQSELYQKVQAELIERQRVEAELQKAKEELEFRVEERTAALKQANEQLQIEVAERRRAQKELQQSEQRFRLLTEVIPQQIWTAQVDGGLDYVNQRVLDYFACTAEQVLGEGWQSAVHPEDLLRSLNCWSKALKTGKPYEIEFRLKSGVDGTYRWHIARALPLYDQEGRLISWFGTNTDIDNLKRIEEELQHQNLRSQLFAEITLKIRQSLQLENILQTTVTEVRSLLQVERVLLYRLWSDGTGTTVTEAVTSGWSALIGKSFDSEVIPKEYQQLYRQGRFRAIEDVENDDIAPCLAEFLQQFGVKAKLVVPIFQREELWGLLIAHNCIGPRQWFDFEIELLQQLANQVGIALAQAELLEALQEREKQYRSVVDNVSEVIFQTDAAGLWTFLNPAWTEITGFALNESIGKNFLEYIYPSDRQYNLELFQQVIKGEKYSSRFETRYLTADGGFRWIEVHTRLTLASDDTILGTSGTLNDITERKQAEEDISNTLNKEKELSELKSNFITTTSHEFRTPLSIIFSSAELLQNYNQRFDEAKKKKHFERIKLSVKYMTHLLEDVLLINRAEAGKLEFNPSWIDLVEFCHNLVEEQELGITTNHIISLQIDCNKVLSTNAYIDEKLLRQILSNLLSNAIKYSPSGSKVHFDLAWMDGSVVFQISDEGIGIPPEDFQHLFELFHRGKNVGTISGTGLGLAIVKKCVDIHQGKIDVKSEVGTGTTFTVTIPLN